MTRTQKRLLLLPVLAAVIGAITLVGHVGHFSACQYMVIGAPIGYIFGILWRGI